MLARPEGILVVTGPTGSGKTTTLYSILSQLNAESVNIMTLEDPVEYPMTHDPPDLGERSGQAGLRQRHPLDDAPGPGHHPGGRDPRPGHRRDGVPRRDDRPPGVHDAAHQLRARRDSAPARHRHPARHHGRQHHRHHRAAPGAQLCPHCKEAYHPTKEERQLLGVEADASIEDLPARRAASTATSGATAGVPRSWRSCAWTAISTNWSRAAPPRGSCAPLPSKRASARWSKRASHASSTASTSIAEVARSVDLDPALPLAVSRRQSMRSRALISGSLPAPSTLYARVPLQSQSTSWAARHAASSTPANEVDLELRLKRMGLDLITFRAIRGGRTTLAKGSVTRRDLITFCFDLEQIITLRHPVHRRPARPARRHREPALPRDAVLGAGRHRGRQDAVAGAGRIPQRLRRGVRQPGPGRRAIRPHDRGVREPGQRAQVAGRAGVADAQAADLSADGADRGVRRDRCSCCSTWCRRW